MKSPIMFLEIILNEIGNWCHTSTTRDLKTITSRFEEEGFSFLTITLPNFGKDLEKGLDQGYVDRNLFRGFAFQAGLPRFLGGFLDLIFDRKDGTLLNDASIDAIHGLRQLTLMWSKVEIACSDERVKSAFDKYIQCEQELRVNDALLPDSFLEEFRRVSALLFGDVLTKVDLAVYNGDIIPKHGPGSTADRLLGNKKFNQKVWTERLEEVFPSGEHLIPSWRDYQSLSDVDFLEPGAEIPVRVIAVPKTLKTPRIIAIEPTAVQYMQQGLMEAIEESIEASDIAFNLIRYKSQVPNQNLAFEGSLTGELATLDLSEASDRVSNQHVRAMLQNFPHLARAVDATRSRKADVPGHGVIRIAKFASMGSALCFPIEAMVFATLVFMGIQDELNVPLTKKHVKSLFGKVRVYGDDIIVPVDFVSSVIGRLEAFGLKVNHNKSFWTGKFRESCGKDYYDGHDVSIIKVRALFPSSREHAAEIISTVSLRNQLYKAGLWDSVRFLDTLLERIIPFPHVGDDSPALGRFSFLGYEIQKMDPNLHRPLVRAAVVDAPLPIDKLDGNGALMKFFLKRGDLPVADREHLKRAGRPDTVGIKIRWVPSF